MTITKGVSAINKFRTWAKNWRKVSAADVDEVSNEWENYFGSYCRCRDSLTWHNPDGSLALNERAKRPLNVAEAVKTSIATNPTTAYVLCIDEGVQDLYASSKTISICIPGCGILMQDKKLDLAKQIANTAIQNKLSKVVVTSHADCGAAGLAANREFEKIKDHHTDTFFRSLIEIVAEDYANGMRALLQEELKNTKIKVEVLHISKLDRPRFHHAFGAVVNFVPKLNIGLLEEKLGLPMFGISANVLDDDTARHDTILAYNIASGVHGFKNRFNKENPFEIIAVVGDENDVIRAKVIFGEMPADLPIRYSLVNASSS